MLGDDRHSIAIFEELTRQDPVNSQAWGDLGYAYLMFGRYADSIAAIHKSLELEPGASTRHEHLVEAKLAVGDPAGALAAIQLEPNDVVRKLGLSNVHAATRQREAALRLLQEVGRDSPEWATMIAAGYARLDERDRTFEWLERALRARDGGVAGLRVDPAFRRVRADPRWQPLLVRIGISDEQVKALDFNISVPMKAGAN